MLLGYVFGVFLYAQMIYFKSNNYCSRSDCGYKYRIAMFGFILTNYTIIVIIALSYPFLSTDIVPYRQVVKDDSNEKASNDD